MIKVIIFDLGGIIVSPEVEKIWNYISDYIGVEYNSFYDFFDKYKSVLTKGKISLNDVYSDVIKHFKLSRFSSRDIVNEHLKIFQKIIIKLNDDAIALVKKLRKNYKVVCLVNAELDVVPLIRKRGIYDHFQKAYISTELGIEKPDLEIYTTVLNDLDYKPQEAVFIDDKEDNVNSAGKLGMYSILYKDNAELKKSFKKLGLVF